MLTTETAIDYMRRNRTPFWWVKHGANRVANNTTIENLDDSMSDFSLQMAALPAGKYQLECSKHYKDRRGSNTINFEHGVSQPMSIAAQIINNPWGVSDAAYKNIVDEARQKLLFEQVMAKMDKFLEEWPEYKKRIDTLWAEDKDGDGTPDVLEIGKKITDMASNVATVKNAWKGGKFLD